MSALLYYIVIKPISFLPFPLLYLLSDIVYFFLYYVISFRKKVVRENLTHSFPAMDLSEIKVIEQKFYKHLADIFLESLKLFSISENQLRKRFIKRNPEVINRFYDEGRSVIIVGGHYNNWEMAAISSNFQIKHQTLGIYSPFHNKYFNKKISESRSRFGITLVPQHFVKRYIVRNKDLLTVTVFGIDQSPTSRKHIYWNTFLKQDTAWFVGAEKYAREFNSPVLYIRIIKVKRGYYEMEFEILEENPANTPEGEITEKTARFLEQEILEKPEYWLWSHRRWKRKREAA
ncbi:MAG: lysophospholipid acyltransferase family protein [Bacteroidales bacterium]|nr:lysophospholipid acyltransferase family protein [Bacteroidales bacterium]